MEEKIKTLLLSKNRDDILIGLNLLGNIDYRAFMAKYGEFYKPTDQRYMLKREQRCRIKSLYYKLEDNFCILVNDVYVFCQCEFNYNNSVEVINH